jgi:hypothetical protein
MLFLPAVLSNRNRFDQRGNDCTGQIHSRSIFPHRFFRRSIAAAYERQICCAFKLTKHFFNSNSPVSISVVRKPVVCAVVLSDAVPESISATDLPAFCSKYAADVPASPAPTTATSTSISDVSARKVGFFCIVLVHVLAINSNSKLRAMKSSLMICGIHL